MELIAVILLVLLVLFANTVSNRVSKISLF